MWPRDNPGSFMGVTRTEALQQRVRLERPAVEQRSPIVAVDLTIQWATIIRGVSESHLKERRPVFRRSSGGIGTL
jgi:hypothetical protein